MGIRSCVAFHIGNFRVEKCPFASDVPFQLQMRLPDRTVRRSVERCVADPPEIGGTLRFWPQSQANAPRMAREYFSGAQKRQMGPAHFIHGCQQRGDMEFPLEFGSLEQTQPATGFHD